MQTQRLKYLSQLCLALAEFYRFPDEEFIRELQNGDWEKVVGELAQRAGLANDNIAWPGDLTYPSLKQEYIRCFIGIGEPAALPVESIYQVWTEDPSAQVMFAKQKGYLMGDSALHIRYLLQSLGLELPEELRGRPDHLVVLLELLAYFLDRLEFQDTLQYLQDHFAWLPDFHARLKEINAHELYVTVTALLMKCIQEIRVLLERDLIAKEVS